MPEAHAGAAAKLSCRLGGTAAKCRRNGRSNIDTGSFFDSQVLADLAGGAISAGGLGVFLDLDAI